MAAKHTPGPWQAHVGCNGDISTMDGYAIAECCLKHSSIDWSSQLANARLIAAAPELLDSLKNAYCIAVDHDDHEPFDWAIYCEMLHQAIAKATGGAQ